MSLYLYLTTYMYTVIPANNDITFFVGLTSGLLRVNGTLDRETLSRYIVTVDVSNTFSVIHSLYSWALFVAGFTRCNLW